MPGKKDESLILDRIGELKQLFRFGGDLIPFIEQLYLFLKDIMPLVDAMAGSLKESTANMPKAQERIDNVTEATLMATQQILDKLDYINSQCEHLAGEQDAGKKGETIQNIQNATMEITFSLQFQDITSQKLGHAKQILEAIHSRFLQLFDIIQGMEIDDQMKKALLGSIQTDSLAGDDSIEKAGEDHIRHSTDISQDEIDKLFG